MTGAVGREKPRTASALPRLIAVVDADAGHAGTASLLLDDFADALVAYARMGGASTAPGLMRLELERADRGRSGGRAHEADAVVIGVDAPLPDCERERIRDQLAASLAPGVRTWCVACCAGETADPARRELAMLARALSPGTAAWYGGLAVGGAEALPSLMRSPRLGAFRRPVAEAVDRLVAAVRLGCPVSTLDAALRGEATGAVPAHRDALDAEDDAAGGDGLDGNVIVPRSTLATRIFYRTHR